MTTQQIEQLVSAFIQRTLPAPEWTHQAHIIVALWHNWHFDFDTAFKLVKNNIIAYNEAVGTPNTEISGYHETLTRFWMVLTSNFLLENNFPSLPLAYHAFIDSPYAGKEVPLTYYSKELLFCPEARQAWVNGDLQSIVIAPSPISEG